ncbi:dephospho-CoA kinase [Allosphingosinicella flava]|uniref:Dephospho-CoA kinase n=1 Tax=Allosphingosinicella flava TaxID=2771430 RepID=A0A7T2GJ98_9SPHN|nr:dephospho-CoA kinase [Sphingosinicella flava]QPQ54543.1 dephospho-CoA kinase [Sphingosinicella flava]
MIVLGLTGSIGMGKSTVARMFADEGIPVFDADAAVHRLQGPEGRLVAAIEAHFPGTTGAAGVDRTSLAERVLGDPAALERLEGLIHPAVAKERRLFLEAHSDSPLVVLDIPLLLEKGGSGQTDKIAVVSAPAEVQRARVLARAGMTPEKFARIVALQMPDADKRALADFVIPTGGPIEDTRSSVRRIIACLTGGADS